MPTGCSEEVGAEMMGDGELHANSNGATNYKQIIRHNRKLLVRSMTATDALIRDLSAAPSIGNGLMSAVNGDHKERRNDQLLDFLTKTTKEQHAVFQAFFEVLREHDQEHVANVFNKNSHKMPMSEEHYQLLIRMRGELTKFIDPDNGLLDQLVSLGVFTGMEFDKVSQAENIEFKCREIVNILLGKYDHDFEIFISALWETGQPHVVYILKGEGIHPMSKEHIKLLADKADGLRNYLDPTNGLIEKLPDVFTRRDKLSIASKTTCDEKSTETIEILSRKPDNAFVQFIDALHATGQGHVVHILTGRGDPPLSDEKVNFIYQHRHKLVKWIDSINTDLINKLVSRAVLTKFDLQRVQTEKKSCWKRNEILLDLIVRKSQKAYDNFVDCLKHTGQEHVLLKLEGYTIYGRVEMNFVSNEVDSSKRETVENGVQHDMARRMSELNENGNMKPNGILFSQIDKGSILVSFKCSDLAAAVKLQELLNSGRLDSLVTELFCPPHTAEGLKSLRITVSDEEFERCEETFKRLSVMTEGHRGILDDASKPLVDKIIVTTELLDKLSLCKRRRQSIEAAETKQEQVRTLLSIVSYQPDSSFARLVDALRETGQDEAASLLSPVRDSRAINESIDWKDRYIELSRQLSSCLLLLNSGPVVPRYVFKKNELHEALESGSFERAAELINSSSREYLTECYFVGNCQESTIGSHDASFKSCLHIISAMKDKHKAHEFCILLLDKLGTNVCEYLNTVCSTAFKDLHCYPGISSMCDNYLLLNASAIHIAAFYGNAELLDLLIGRGAVQDVEVKGAISAMLWWCSMANHCTCLLSTLHLATFGGQVDTMRILLLHGANTNAQSVVESYVGHTALFIAAMESNTDAVALLLSKDADVNLTGEDGLTPLHAAAISGNVTIAEMLVERGVNANAMAKNGITPLCIAAKSGHFEMVRFLLGHKADATLSEDKESKESMICFYGVFHSLRAETLTQLLNDSRRSMLTSGNAAVLTPPLYDNADTNKDDPLNLAASNENNYVTGAEGSGTPVISDKLSATRDVFDAIDTGSYFSKIGANLWQSSLIVPLDLYSPGSPARSVASRDSSYLSSYELEGDDIDIAISPPVEIDLSSNRFQHETDDEEPKLHAFKHDACEHRTLIDAIRSGSLNLAKQLLLENDADVNVTDGEGNTPLHLASQARNIQLVRLLLDRKADVNAVRADGFTAFTIAVRQSCVEVARLLVGRGADMNAGYATTSVMRPQWSKCEHDHSEMPGQSMPTIRRQFSADRHDINGPIYSQEVSFLPGRGCSDKQVTCATGSRKKRRLSVSEFT